MNHLSKITLLFACVLAMGNLYAQSAKTADAGNDSQALIKKCQSLGYVKGTPQMKQCIAQIYAASPEASSNQPQQSNDKGNVIGTRATPETGGRIFLYDSPCPVGYLNASGNFPYKWESRLDNGNGAVQWTGCYAVNQQTQQVVSINPPDGRVAYEPLSIYQGGNNNGQSGAQSILDGLNRAANYWNNSANETQRNMQNLTPSFGGSNRGMNCTPDGRGGYNCR